MKRKMYVFHRDKKTGEVIKLNYERILDVMHNGWKSGYEVTFWKINHPIGNDAGAGLRYFNMSEKEGEVYYNTLWLYTDDYVKAKKLFYQDEIRKLEEDSERIQKRIERLKQLM